MSAWARKPCARCGGPKDVVGRGETYCSSCKREVSSRTCLTCKQVKPAVGYSSSAARRCIQCCILLPRRACVICSIPVGHADLAKTTCKSKACVAEARVRGLREAWARRDEVMASRTSKRCPGCAVEKPLTLEHWCPGGGNYPSQMFDSYCKACRAAIQTDRRRVQRGQEPLVRERPASLEGREDAHAFQALPAAPLHRALTAAGERHHLGVVGVCTIAGISDRNVRGWHPVTGDRKSIAFDVADRIITRLGWCWDDVWVAPEDYRIARAAFEGEVLAA